MRMKRTLLLIMLVGTIPLLTSCWNAREIDKIFFAHAVGVDYKDGQYIIYTQLANFQGLSREGAQTGKPTAQVGKGTGETIDTAFHDMYRSTQRRIFWGHLSAVVFSEAALEHAFQDTLDLFTRFRETRYTMWVFGTDQPLIELLSTFPIQEPTNAFSRLGDPSDIYRQSSYVEPMRLFQLIRDYYEPGKTVLLPQITVDRRRWREGGSQRPQLAIQAVGLIKDKNFKGWLNREQLRGSRWMNPATQRAPLVLKEKDKTVAVVISQKPDVKIEPQVKGGRAYFRIQVKLKGTVIQLNQHSTEEKLASLAEEEIKKQILKTYRLALEKKADIYQLSQVLYRKNPDQWHQLTEKGVLQLDQDSIQSIQVDMKIRHTGKNELVPELEKRDRLDWTR
ncbi:MAG: Ger(x)C family spore germination protein [Bacillaceae bacterium]|nr:Ger(x)C family spore germination protein [Bacillaceae bacterium]